MIDRIIFGFFVLCVAGATAILFAGMAHIFLMAADLAARMPH